MACLTRERTGTCNHSQCPHPTQSGFECVEIVAGCCEVGEGCVKECPFSWEKTNYRMARIARNAFAAKYPVEK